MTSYQPHKPGEQPNKPDRDGRGVQRFANSPQTDASCPPGLMRDPATGECVPPPQPEEV
ncbi:hypothetical protein [Streptomyces griseorubiginosus]|uniref:hypothetical protein n=1 Tax=Streptomyces griseorubiginosus TaxID=67304 RepID=UPI000AA49EEB|nr:hypothetical protein [Streptomyces griseorubiginosus]